MIQIRIIQRDTPKVTVIWSMKRYLLVLHFLCPVSFLDMEYTFYNVRFGCKRVFIIIILFYFFIDCLSYFINVGFIFIVSFLCHIDNFFFKNNIKQVTSVSKPSISNTSNNVWGLLLGYWSFLIHFNQLILIAH